jgi:hypothetical protein
MQDSAIAHTVTCSINVSNKVFEDRMISPRFWPANYQWIKGSWVQNDQRRWILRAVKIHNTLPFRGEDKPSVLYKILQHVKDPCRV